MPSSLIIFNFTVLRADTSLFEIYRYNTVDLYQMIFLTNKKATCITETKQNDDKRIKTSIFSKNRIDKMIKFTDLWHGLQLPNH